jgi:tetratricopeptide (TPR) repeat protein
VPLASLPRVLGGLLVAAWLATSVGASSTLRADEAPWAAHNTEGMAAASAGDWAAAETAFRAALDALAEDGADDAPPLDRVADDDARVAVVGGNLAVVLLEQDETTEARALFERALAIRRAVFGARDPAIAESLNNLAELERRTGNLQRARTLHEAALGVRREVLDEGHPDVAESLNNLGVLLHDLNEPEAAAASLGEAYALRRERLGPRHRATLESAGNLAAVSLEQGDLATAEGVLRAAIDAEADAPNSLPAQLLRSAVDVFLVQGAVDDAVLLCEAHVVEDPVAVGRDLAAAELVAACARALGRVGGEARAGELIERHLAALDDPPPDVEAELRWGLAETATIAGDLEAAEAGLDRVVELLAATDDPRLPTALNNRGSVAFERGRPLEAAADLEAALDILDDPARSGDAGLLRDVLANYAIVLRTLDRNTAAVDVESRLIELVTEAGELEIAPAAGD